MLHLHSPSRRPTIGRLSTVEHSLRPLAVAVSLLAWPVAQAAASTGADGWESVTQPITDYLESHPTIEGASLVVRMGAVTLHEQHWGSNTAQTQIPIGSATKILSAIAILSLVDDGLITLDAPAWTFLPAEFPQGTVKGEMTVRQMFSHTAGLPGQSQFVSDLSITLAEAVASIGAVTPMIADPGQVFAYGGVSMHVAGRIAEVVTDQPWIELFEERVTAPLAMTATDFDGFGPTQNPRIAGGGRSTAADVVRALEMLAAGGMSGGMYGGMSGGSGPLSEVLSEVAVATMFTDQTDGAAPSLVPAAIDKYLGYGIGCWIELVDSESGSPIGFTSPGAFGTTPWVDTDLGVYGVFMVDATLGAFDGFIDDVRAYARQVALASMGDLNKDGVVSAADLGILLGAWGPCSTCDGCAADLTGDCTVDGADLGLLLGSWS
jgi:CubicO group peptidase (beta-lactamase class C family)